MSVIQEVIANYLETANHLDRAGLQGDARQARQRVASLSEYADITEARAAGFATVEEMTRQVGRSATETVADYLNAQFNELNALRSAIQIADLDKYTIKDGDVVRSGADETEVFDIHDGREIKSFTVNGLGALYYKEATAILPAIGCFRKNSYSATPPAAEIVALRVHEELDDAPPPPTDAQMCTAHLLNYLDAKFKESSELAFKLDEESTCRDQKNCDRLIDISTSLGVYAFIGFAAAAIAFFIFLASQP